MVSALLRNKGILQASKTLLLLPQCQQPGLQDVKHTQEHGLIQQFNQNGYFKRNL